MAKIYAEGYECYEDENYKKIAYDAFLCGFTAKCESCILPDIDKAAKKIYPMTTTPPTPIEVAAYYNAAQQRLREAFKTGVKWIEKQGVEAYCIQSYNPVSESPDKKYHCITLEYEESENTPYVRADDRVKVILRK